MSEAAVPLYRAVLREVRKASRSARASRSPVVAAQFRAAFAAPRDAGAQTQFATDIANALTFMRAQRTHKALLERYNPLHDMSPEERRAATARRVGLSMPKTV